MDKITFKDISKCFDMKLEDACLQIGLSSTSMKKLCRQFHIQRWPYRKISSLKTKAAKLKKSLEEDPYLNVYDKLKMQSKLKNLEDNIKAMKTREYYEIEYNNIATGRDTPEKSIYPGPYHGVPITTPPSYPTEWIPNRPATTQPINIQSMQHTMQPSVQPHIQQPMQHIQQNMHIPSHLQTHLPQQQQFHLQSMPMTPQQVPVSMHSQLDSRTQYIPQQSYQNAMLPPRAMGQQQHYVVAEGDAKNQLNLTNSKLSPKGMETSKNNMYVTQQIYSSVPTSNGVQTVYHNSDGSLYYPPYQMVIVQPSQGSGPYASPPPAPKMMQAPHLVPPYGRQQEIGSVSRQKDVQ